jgi:LysM repeat protein
MKFLLVLAGSLWLTGTVLAQSSAAILDEKVDRLRAEVEAVQFNQKKLQQQVDDLQEQVLNLRKAGSGVGAADVEALQAKIKAVDAAREKDKQVILDTLAKELAALSGGKPASKPPGKSNIGSGAGGKEHEVQKGETLSAIARQHNVTVADLRKANNLSADALKVGQKLTIPQK